MGFTRYWKFKPIPKGKTELIERKYQKALKEIQGLVYNAHNEGFYNLSGYTAHVKPGKYGGVKFNGAGDEAHEDFVLRERYKQNDRSNFCKTNYKNYDAIVAASILILKAHLNDLIEIGTD